MLGAVAGDIIGSPFEWINTSQTDFELCRSNSGEWHGRNAVSHPHFTDDTVITLAVARWLQNDPEHDRRKLIRSMVELAGEYPQAGYTPRFYRWLQSEYHNPVVNFGNGTAMRVSPVGMYVDDLAEVIRIARISAEVSHNHPDSIKGAEAVAQAVWMARKGRSKDDIRFAMTHDFGYDLDMKEDVLRSLLRGCIAEPVIVNGEDIGEVYYRETGKIDSSCNLSVTAALISFLDTDGFENSIRRAISLGGDSDTIAAICGSVSAPFYGGVPDDIALVCDRFLDNRLRTVMADFERMCAGEVKTESKPSKVTVNDMLSVIRTDGRDPVFVVDKSRKDIRDYLKEKFGEDIQIIEPKHLPRVLESMKARKQDGTYIESPRPDVRSLRFENGELKGPLSYQGPNAAPLEERQAAYSVMRDILDYASRVKSELQRRSGYAEGGSICYEHAYYPVVFHNRVEIYQGQYLDGYVSFDEYTGKIKIAEDGDLREGEYLQADWCRERVFDSRRSYLDSDGIKAAIGRFCLDDGVGVNDTERKSNIDVALQDMAMSRDPRINPQLSAQPEQAPSIRIK